MDNLIHPAVDAIPQPMPGDLKQHISLFSLIKIFFVTVFICFFNSTLIGCSEGEYGGVPLETGRNAFPIDHSYLGPSLLPLRVQSTSGDKDLYRFFVIAFGAAPGGIYIEQLREAYLSGMSIQELVNIFTTKKEFLSRYPAYLSNETFANQLVEDVVGDSASHSAKSEATRDIQDALKLPNWSRGDVIFRIFNNLANIAETDSKWGNTSRQLANRVAVAKFFSEQLQYRSQDVDVLRASVSWVSASALPVDLASAIASSIESKGGTSVLPSGMTSGEFKASALRVWLKEPDYLDQNRLENDWGFLASQQVCHGFISPDIIPATMGSMRWDVKALGPLYPNRNMARVASWLPNTQAPKPFESIDVDATAYGTGDKNLPPFVFAIRDLNEVLNSASHSETFLKVLRDILVDWARSDALSKGLDANFSWVIVGQEPVHYEVLPLTINLIHSFALTFDSMSAAERQQVGPWVQRIVATVLKGGWGSRQDNKAYFRTQIALTWGILTGQTHLVENAILNFKHAVNEMRPDGSFPSESARGGMANMYQISATESVISLATSLQEHFGVPAMQFHRNGRSVWSAATRSLDLWKNPLTGIKKYAKSCPWGSSGTIDQPVMSRLDSDLSFLKIVLKRSAPDDLRARVSALPFENISRFYDGDTREGIDIYHAVSGE